MSNYAALLAEIDALRAALTPECATLAEFPELPAVLSDLAAALRACEADNTALRAQVAKDHARCTLSECDDLSAHCGSCCPRVLFPQAKWPCAVRVRLGITEETP